MTLHFILSKSISLTNKFIPTNKNFTYLQKLLYDDYMVLIPGKFYYISFGSNTAIKEFVFEDGTSVLQAEEHVIFIRNNNQFPLDLLFPFQAIVQNGCK